MTVAAHMTHTQIDVLKLHSDLVGIPSLSREEGTIADFIEDYLTAHDVAVDRFGNNIVFSLGTGSRTLLLNSHLDVVPPSQDHPFDPFTPTVQGGRIYGRGAVDAKASVSAMISAVLSLKQEGWIPNDGRIVVALTVCEELGGNQNGLDSILSRIPEPDAAIVGEPTMMEPCVAQKGLLILKLVSKGRTAHAARSHLGVNAVELMAEDILRLKGLTFDRVHPYLGETTLTVTTIEGGNARNVVPDLCVSYLDIRSTPSYTHDELASMVRNAVQADVQVHSKRLIPVETAADEAIVRACLSANPEGRPFGSPTVCDWVFLGGVPAVKMGPGDSSLSHTGDEHIETSELVRGADIYRRTIRAYFEAHTES